MRAHTCLCAPAACVRALLEAGADLEAAAKDGDTPLHSACLWGREACVRVLVEVGANVTAMDKVGATPLSLTRRLGRSTAAFEGELSDMHGCRRLLLYAAAHRQPEMKPAKVGDPMLAALCGWF
ncbi:hypothetical protein EON67_00350 [archaeon]|nr:MAG: hypothetical protein EON67_00350 [archaeon]